MRPRLRSKIGALLLSNAVRGNDRVQRVRRGLVTAATVILVVLFLRIRLTSFEFSGIEVGFQEDWRFLFVLLVVDVYFLVRYYAVALAEALGHPLQLRLQVEQEVKRHQHAGGVAKALDYLDAFIPFVLGYAAAAWLVVALLLAEA